MILGQDQMSLEFLNHSYFAGQKNYFYLKNYFDILFFNILP